MSTWNRTDSLSLARAAEPSAACRPAALERLTLETGMRGASLLASRTARIVVLLLAITLLSIADLHNTLLHLRTAGMSEGNPIARLVISYNSPGLLVAWKLGCTLLTCFILFAARKRVSAEIAGWFCCLILVWLTIHWGIYNDEVHAITPSLNSMGHLDPNLWVTMSP